MWYKAVFRGRMGAIALCLSLPGCTAISDCKYEVSQKIRTGQAWHEFDGCNDECFTGDYKIGWKAGYYDVATGGDGQPPLIAPKKYWKPPVFIEHDPSRRNEWYAGFQDGASCAKCQPDHHFLQTFLPEQTQYVSHAASPGSHETFPLEHLRSYPDQVPAEVSPAAEIGEGGTSPGLQVEPSAPMPEQPANSGPEEYEKDPEGPASGADISFDRFSDSVSSTEKVSQGSLLQQLVLNATQGAVD